MSDKPSLEELITACTNIIWTCGPQHSAVNYTQYPFFADARTLPFAIHRMASDLDQHQPELFDTPRDRIRDQAAVITRLSAFRYDKLGYYKPEPGDLSEYGDLGVPYLGTERKGWSYAVYAFQHDLRDSVSKKQKPFPTIPKDQERIELESNPRWGYDYLHPDNITNAISI